MDKLDIMIMVLATVTMVMATATTVLAIRAERALRADMARAMAPDAHTMITLAKLRAGRAKTEALVKAMEPEMAAAQDRLDKATEISLADLRAARIAAMAKENRD